MTSIKVEALNPAKCPVCGQPNECQMCTSSAYKGPCWCATESIPEKLLNQVPEHLRNRACICRRCIRLWQ